MVRTQMEVNFPRMNGVLLSGFTVGSFYWNEERFQISSADNETKR